MKEKLKFYPKSHKKECSKCHKIKDLDMFHKGIGHGNKAYHCKECVLRYKKEYYWKHKERLSKEARKYWKKIVRTPEYRSKRKNNRLKSLYGITLEDYNKMLEEQNNQCAICNNLFKSDKSTHVDHCHETGKIRGLLCNHCNAGLGHFQDDLGILYNAAYYLEVNPIED